MAETAHQPASSEPGEVPSSRARRARWQVGLRAVILLTAAIAVWMTYFLNRQYNALLEARIATLRPLARELVVDDETKAAVVTLEELWSDDNRWDVYLPPGQYRLCLGTRAIDQNGLAPIVASRLLRGGRHTLGLELQKTKSAWRITVDCDGARQISVEEPLGWNPAQSSMTVGGFSESTQVATDAPIVLHRCIFGRVNASGSSSTPSEPSEGMLLWIERMAASNAQR